MAQIETELGYGRRAIVEADTFTRIIAGQFYDDEEVRRDVGEYAGPRYEYVGVAVTGSLSSENKWCVVRATFNEQSRMSRMQYRANISWDQREQGW